MDTSRLKSFAKLARLSLIEQVSSKLYQVLKDESTERRESPHVVAKLEEAISDKGEQALVDQVAYIWFNRFCALRFMDANGYNRMGVVSPAEGQVQPEILAEAKAGHIDDGMVRSPQIRERVLGLLNGSITSRDAQAEAYRLLIVAVCNHYNASMPFLFEQIQDYTELLMPDDLLSDNSILDATRQAMTPEHCENVEVIGWLYQFYISDKKDDVFAALKKGKKITPENIPAATQLFTPHWIVRYLVENSLGRLWMLNHPESGLIDQMDYYIKPEEPETDFLKIDSPEEIKLSDPACGSGHMLTYAFDLMYAIYEEHGYSPPEIPEKILTHNLFGIEIDPRAGALAAFALTMKAREKYRRFLTGKKVVHPNICVLENILFEPEELSAYMDKVGRDLFSNQLQEMLGQWDEADNFGSLIRPAVTDVSEVIELLKVREMDQDLLLAPVHQKVLKALRQADYLSPKYQVVVANPPYMGGRGMNDKLKDFVKARYPEAKADAMTCFMNLAGELLGSSGFWGMINLPSWMFLGSFEELRTTLVSETRICTLLHLGRGVFGSDFGTVAFTCFKPKGALQKSTGVYRRLFEEHVQVRNVDEIESLFLDPEYGRYLSDQSKFGQLPGTPIAYWVSDQMRSVFQDGLNLKEIGDTRQGMATSDNNRFLRFWPEVSMTKVALGISDRSEAKNSGKKWFPYNKGGEFRKWYGNADYFVNWENDGEELLEYAASLYGSPTRTIKSISEYFKESVSWSKVSAGNLAMRYFPKGFIFDVAGCSIFSNSNNNLIFLLAFTNTPMVRHFLSSISPTINYEAGQIATLPILEFPRVQVVQNTEKLIEIAKADWDSNEESWDFQHLPVLNRVQSNDVKPLEQTYQELRVQQLAEFQSVKELEETNSRYFLEHYGLSEELSANIPDDEITLRHNSKYRYDEDKSESEHEALLLADTMREFISYAVGCMLGRYSLDKPGLILANQGDSVENYYAQVPEPSFRPDEENVIPLLDGDWFTDDISERFKKFLKVTFGNENFDENLTFLEDALYPDNKTGKKRKTIRDYFLKEFYNHHVKLYKKRPIYWLFSSPKGTFNALIYMHRYRPDTVSVVLNKYLREYQTKLQAKKESLEQVSINAAASPREKTQALKEIAKLDKMLAELKEYEREILYPLATQNIEIDLDDGVKVNYPKFGKALKKVTGLS